MSFTDADLFRLTRDTCWWTQPVADDWYDARSHLLTLYETAKWINWPDCRMPGPLLPLRAMEIGVRHGITTIPLLMACRETNGKLISLEMDPEWAGHATDRIKAAELEQWWQLETVNSNDYAATFTGELDLLWIDGDHSAEQVRRDLANYGSKVRAGGIVMLHDYYSLCQPCWPPVGGPFPSYVSIAVEEARASGRYEICTIPFGFGLTIMRVKWPQECA